MKYMKKVEKSLVVLIALLCFPTTVWAEGGISWEEVHKKIKGQDKVLIAFIDQTFDVAPRGGAMRPLVGGHAGERFAPYNFFAKLKGAKGDYVFNLTFDITNEKSHPWSVLVQEKWY
ncbi:MAG: hypothetical protein LV480_06480 [Methylacidiphilales bacterium]|nr:hypothetical protein [Candidatus Methylacidiphilales bacterium]